MSCLLTTTKQRSRQSNKSMSFGCDGGLSSERSRSSTRLQSILGFYEWRTYSPFSRTWISNFTLSRQWSVARKYFRNCAVRSSLYSMRDRWPRVVRISLTTVLKNWRKRNILLTYRTAFLTCTRKKLNNGCDEDKA